VRERLDYSEETDMFTKIQASVSPQPFVKWAGGKRALLSEIQRRIPEYSGRYIEPFVGGGAVFFSQPATAQKIINDFNPDLIEVYKAIRDKPKQLVEELKKHVNSQSHFSEVRSWDRRADFRKSTTPVERASRLIFLNKTCFNGLYRVNSNGHFNVPFAHSKNPDFTNQKNLYAVSAFLNTSDKNGFMTTLMAGDYRSTTAKAVRGDFIYLDPPYDPVSPTSAFVAYQKAGFNRQNQIELRDELIRLTEEGVAVLLSNSDTPFIESLYADSEFFHIDRVVANRAISAKASSRGKVSEVLVNNFRATGVEAK
jgi:DNA adenine methylase